MKRKIVVEILSSLLILLFVYTAVSKWLAFNTFVGQMNNQPFPNWMTPIIVWTLPATEIIISLLLMFGRTQLIGFRAALILMLLFTVYTLLVLINVFGRRPCACGGVIENLTWSQHLVFNLFFVAVAIAGILLKKREANPSIS